MARVGEQAVCTARRQPCQARTWRPWRCSLILNKSTGVSTTLMTAPAMDPAANSWAMVRSVWSRWWMEPTTFFARL